MTPVSQSYSSPDQTAWFGTNRIGQDLFVRNMAAAANAFETAVPVALIGLLLGFSVGASAALNSQWRAFANVVVNTLDAIPYYLIVVALAAFLRETFFGFVIAISAGLWTTTARVIREECTRIIDSDSFQIARRLGAGHTYLLIQHLLPALRSVLATQFIIMFAVAVKIEVVLAFLGLSNPGKPSWGLMLASAAEEMIAGQYGNLLVAGASLTALLWSLNAVSDALAARHGGTGAVH